MLRKYTNTNLVGFQEICLQIEELLKRSSSGLKPGLGTWKHEI